jgi:hypothetical protein
MDVKEIKEGVKEIKGLSDSTVWQLWAGYQQTVDFRGTVIRSNDWGRFKDWLLSTPLQYLASCEDDLILAMSRKLNVSRKMQMFLRKFGYSDLGKME